MRYCTLALRIGLLLSVGVLVVGAGASARAQTPSSPDVRRDTHVHTYARPGHATHTVYVWGAVNQPGVWKIEPDTGLVELFSVIHPSGYGVETPSTKREVVLRIHRSSGGQPRVVSELRLKELLGMRPGQRPTLQAGDVLEVRTVEERKFSFQAVSSVIGTISSLVLLGLRIFGR